MSFHMICARSECWVAPLRSRSSLMIPKTRLGRCRATTHYFHKDVAAILHLAALDWIVFLHRREVEPAVSLRRSAEGLCLSDGSEIAISGGPKEAQIDRPFIEELARLAFVCTTSSSQAIAALARSTS